MLRNQPVQLTPAQRHRITSARQTSNPLFLTILLEYLACTAVGQDASAATASEDVDQQIAHYLSAPDGMQK